MEFIDIVQQFVNVKAVGLAIFGVQGIKRLLPSPDPGKPWTVVSGTISTRLLPFLPLLIGFVVCYLLEADSKFTADNAVRGIMSGVSASYGYRTTKVSIFGD